MILFDKIGLILFHFAWQATAIALMSYLLLFVFKRADSKVRYTICCFSLLLMIALPVCFSISNLIKDPYSFNVSAINHLPPVDTKEEFYNGKLIGITYRTGQTQVSLYEELMFYVNRYTPLITIIWMLGVMLTTLYRIYGFSTIRSLVRQAQSVAVPLWELKIKGLMQKIGLKRVITILQSPSIDTPAVIGFLKPVLLIPVSFFTGVESTYIDAIILHELAHIKRYDYLVNIIQLVVETLGFFHPAVWWISNRIRRERENCCDDYAVEILGDRLIYVKSLVQLEEMRQQPSFITAANGSSLSYRVSRLLGIKSNIYGSPLFNFAAASIVALFLITSLGFVMTNSNDGKLLSSFFKNVTNSKHDDNLVAYFPFNGNASDESMYKQKTYTHNVVLCEDRFGRKKRALDFNGKDSYISTNEKNEINSAESITICSWVYPRRAKNWESWICKDGPKWGSEWRVGFGEDKNTEWGLTTCKLISGRNFWDNYWITNSELPINKWTHVAVSVDQNKNIVTVYMNGKKVGILKNLKGFEKYESSVLIGFQRDDNAYFDGKIDDVRIYNCTLSDNEVRNIYKME
jgi:beta-lactamase regulating signal transducer with metallopeptidase domain